MVVNVRDSMIGLGRAASAWPLARALLAAGAEVNARTKGGANALTWAADAKVRELLLQAGAKP